MTEEPKVGVAIILKKDERILLMKRKAPHGQGTWSTPGGHLEHGETPEQCAAREAKEEVGLDVVDIRFRAITNDVFGPNERHYISIWMEGVVLAGEPDIVANDEVDEIGWFTLDNLPSPLFLPFQNFLEEKSYPPK